MRNRAGIIVNAASTVAGVALNMGIKVLISAAILLGGFIASPAASRLSKSVEVVICVPGQYIRGNRDWFSA